MGVSMHAVVLNVTVHDRDTTTAALRDQFVPQCHDIDKGQENLVSLYHTLCIALTPPRSP